MNNSQIKAIIGLGNPGNPYKNTRHNIGFRIVDAIAQEYNGIWRKKDNMEIAEISINSHKVMLIKPQTFMNSSGQVLPYLKKQGINSDQILVAHDELEMSFGKMGLKFGGSAKGHNGLKSIISQIGPDFWRLRFGIGRPENKEDVPNYVLQNFDKSQDINIVYLINESIVLTLNQFFNNKV
ncbi:aminoacyl-tRNA hydrolase [Candidatus Babela massiliensis]|uniref:Peptidyl-tRNA hydrolase n=1 Tax=Candidatus Babela massiliensis TaxID=673862 RepID=V6DH27_9BACT|nr:aminoacyl-tRNA hydrolase [Candidatus Babela massiliensis]CDK30865.1 Peptidyl-tRNA hydrolase [Candidatus Babela massiliensis]